MTTNPALEAAARKARETGFHIFKGFTDAAVERIIAAAIDAYEKARVGNLPEPIIKAVERILDEHSAWIARPNHDVTKAVALAAGIAASLHYEKAREPEIERLRAENERLEKLVYVPGMWKCPKCKFTLLQRSLNAHSGAVTARDEPGDKCPNCDGPLWRVSERDAGNEMVDRAEEAFEAKRAAEADLARAKEALEFYAYKGNWISEEQVNEQELFDTVMGDDLGARAYACLAFLSQPRADAPSEVPASEMTDDSDPFLTELVRRAAEGKTDG